MSAHALGALHVRLPVPRRGLVAKSTKGCWAGRKRNCSMHPTPSPLHAGLAGLTRFCRTCQYLCIYPLTYLSRNEETIFLLRMQWSRPFYNLLCPVSSMITIELQINSFLFLIAFYFTTYIYSMKKLYLLIKQFLNAGCLDCQQFSLWCAWHRA